jgi:hypothetical protein
VADREWQGNGPEFTIDAGGRRWRLALDGGRPGLYGSDGRSVARLLALDHIAAVGQRDDQAFAASLVSFERHRGRVQASFAPRGWHGVNIRESWEPTPDSDGFDLDVQLWTTSTGVCWRVEVAVVSAWLDVGRYATPSGRYRVDARDVRAAAMSDDGREPASILQCLTTMPVPTSAPHVLDPVCYPVPGPSPEVELDYFDMVQPNDCARRIMAEFVSEVGARRYGPLTRYGLFGYDLEKGVVLRGRLRGVWLPHPCGEPERSRRYQAFLEEPPPLGP